MKDQPPTILTEKEIMQNLSEDNSTHSTAVSYCVGVVLLKMAKIYGDYQNINDPLMPESKVNHYLTQLEEEVTQQNDEELTAAWEYIKKRLAEPATKDNWDNVPFWEETYDVFLVLSDTPPMFELLEKQDIKIPALIKFESSYWLYSASNESKPVLVELEPNEELEQINFTQNKSIKVSVNQCKNIHTLIANEWGSRIIPLSTVLALVYAALDDDQKYEDKTKEGRNFRLKTLFNSFKSLASGGTICHLGIRHDFVFTLNGVYPGIEIIEDFDALVTDLMKKEAGIILKRYKKTNQVLYKEVLLNEVKYNPNAKNTKKRHHTFQADLLAAKDIIKAKFTKKMEACNLSMTLYPIHKVDGYLGKAGWKCITVSMGADNLQQAIYVLFNIQFSVEESSTVQVKSLEIAKNWIESSCNFFNEKHNNAVISFLAVYNAWRNLQKNYYSLLYCWYPTRPKQIELNTAKFYAKLSKFMGSYFETCIKNNSLMPLSETELNQLEDFNALYASYSSDNETLFLKTFFANYAAYNMEDSRNERAIIEYILKAYDPVFKKKYILTDEAIEQLLEPELHVLPGGMTIFKEFEAKPELTNRFFLQALTVKPEEWSKKFYQYFCMFHDKYKPGGFTPEDDENSSVVLKEWSYPDDFMAQLKYVRDYYDYIHQKQEGSIEKPQRPDCYFFSPHLMNANFDLKPLLTHIDEVTAKKYMTVYFDALGIKKAITSVSMNLDNMLTILRFLSIPEDKKSTFYNNIMHAFSKHDFLTRTVKLSEFYQLIKPLIPMNVTIFDILNKGFGLTTKDLKGITYGLFAASLSLMETLEEKIKFIDELEKVGFNIENCIKNYDEHDQFAWLLLSNTILKDVNLRNHIIHRLGKERLNKCIKPDAVVELIAQADGVLDTNFLEVWGVEQLIDSLNTADKFVSLLGKMRSMDSENFLENYSKLLKKLGGDTYLKIIFNGVQANPNHITTASLSEYIPKDVFALHFLAVLKNSIVKLEHYIHYAEIAHKMSNYLPESEKTLFFELIGPGCYYQLMENSYILTSICATLDSFISRKMDYDNGITYDIDSYGNKKSKKLKTLIARNNLINKSRELLLPFYALFFVNHSTDPISEYHSHTIPIDPEYRHTSYKNAFKNNQHIRVSRIMLIYVVLQLELFDGIKNELIKNLGFKNMSGAVSFFDKLLNYTDKDKLIIQAVITNISSLNIKDNMWLEQCRTEIEKIFELAEEYIARAKNSSSLRNDNSGSINYANNAYMQEMYRNNSSNNSNQASSDSISPENKLPNTSGIRYNS